MTAKEIKCRFSCKDIEQTLWARTKEGKALRLIAVGRKWITLMTGAGERIQVEEVQDVKPSVSDLYGGDLAVLTTHFPTLG